MKVVFSLFLLLWMLSVCFYRRRILLSVYEKLQQVPDHEWHELEIKLKNNTPARRSTLPPLTTKSNSDNINGVRLKKEKKKIEKVCYRSLCSLSCFEYHSHRDVWGSTAAYRKTLVSSQNNGFFLSLNAHLLFIRLHFAYRSSHRLNLHIPCMRRTIYPFGTSKTFFAFWKRNNRTINDSSAHCGPFSGSANFLEIFKFTVDSKLMW